MLAELLKTAAKVGLKSAAPVLGTLGSELASTAVGKLIDKATKSTSSDLEERLFQRIEIDLTNALGAEFSADTIPEVVGVTVRDILGSKTSIFDHWSSGKFDHELASKEALKAGGQLLRDLNDGEQMLCRHFIEAFFRAIAEEKSAIDQTELKFRQLVLGNLDAIEKRASTLSEGLQQNIDDLVAIAVVRIPFQPWTSEYSPPGALLRADIDDPVPFHGREGEAASFTAWCDDDRALSVQVITGPGGIGKSRFMLEMCTRQRQFGWQAGFLDSRLSIDLPRAWNALLADERSLAIVIDYAETRREQVTELIARLLRTERTQKTRIVLLARSADDWWEELKRQSNGVGDLLTGPASQTTRLEALTMSEDERTNSYQIAREHFSTKLAKTSADSPPDNLEEPFYERTLLLHMSALAAVESMPVKGDQGILDYVLQRERRFWTNHISVRDLPDYMESSVGQFMAAVTLVGGCQSESDAQELASKLPLLADQPLAVQRSVVDILHDIYPGDRWIEPVLPDLLGEHLCQTELDESSGALFDIIFGDAELAS